jgi:hypothetical protein
LFVSGQFLKPYKRLRAVVCHLDYHIRNIVVLLLLFCFVTSAPPRLTSLADDAVMTEAPAESIAAEGGDGGEPPAAKAAKMLDGSSIAIVTQPSGDLSKALGAVVPGGSPQPSTPVALRGGSAQDEEFKVVEHNPIFLKQIYFFICTVFIRV